MKKFKSLVVCLLGMAAMLGMVSCTNEHEEKVTNRAAKAPEPIEENRTVSYSIFSFNCNPSEASFTQTMTSEISFLLNGEVEESMKEAIKADCSLKAEKDTVRRSDMAAENNGVASLSGNNAKITYSDGQVLDLVFQTKAQYVKYLGKTYRHGWDSVTAVRPLAVKYEDNTARRAASQYVKNVYQTGYPVEVTTTQYYGGGNVYQSHKDTLLVSAITLEMANNSSEYSIDNTGVEILNDTQQKDSVIIIETWADGHKEQYPYPTILNRWLKNIERREVVVPSFDGATYANGFGSPEIRSEKLVREDEMWSVYGREYVIRKVVSVDGHSEEVIYTYYGERAEFHFNGMNYSFDYIDWSITNYNDNFKVAAVSTKNGYDELSYTNEIRTDYAGYVKMAEELIDWYKEQVVVIGFDAINAVRTDYPTYTWVSLDKIAYYSDGTNKKVGTFSAKLPISVNPLTNWVLNEDVWGVYTSGAFEGSQTGKSAEVAEKFFSYNQYSYRYANTVAGQTNALSVSAPNDIVFNDGDVEYKFSNSDLAVDNKGDNTSRVSEDESKTTYAYTCLAGVTFGESSQDCTLPGTINLVKAQRNHDHGKVVATYMTSTPDESRSHWYNVACIQFEDGYRMVGMTANESMSFNFTMASWGGVNSAVYTNGMWVPAFAEDNAGAGCMVWTGENGGRRVLDYITATAQGWNNGHNTVWDIRREGRISQDGYSVTFYLNGLAGQTLEF